MYESFFELRERPFDLTPNPRFLLLTGRHREALSNLHYGVTRQKGLTLLLGEAGTGKTTLIRAALQQWELSGHRIAYLNNPTLTRAEFVESVATALDLGLEAGASKVRFLSALTELVMRRHGQGLVTGLLIDEAQCLSDELLEEVRLLANIETPSEKVFPVVLAGQPELAARLNEPGLRQLKQRVALRCRLDALDVREAAVYISGRIRLAGGVSRALFTREAVMAIHEYSGGIPRVINVICDNVLLSAFATSQSPAPRALVEEVCRDFDITRQSEPAAPDDTSALAEPVPAPVLQDAARQAVHAPAAEAEAPAAEPAKPVPPAGHPGGRSLFGHFTARRRFSFSDWRG